MFWPIFSGVLEIGLASFFSPGLCFLMLCCFLGGGACV